MSRAEMELNLLSAREATKRYAEMHHLDQQHIAEAAYYKAEKRGFAPGFEVQDWAEAENELLTGLE